MTLSLDNNKDIEFLSPPIVVTISSKTPKVIDTSTPKIQPNLSTKPKQYKKDLLNPVIYKKGKVIPQEKIQETALKMTQKLAKLNYRDTGFLSNATTFPIKCNNRRKKSDHHTIHVLPNRQI